MTRDLTPELWKRVFNFVRKPHPIPHSKEITNITFQPFAQLALYACLRVSKTWYRLSAPILYHTIITRCFRRLVSHLDLPPIPNIPSKLILLGTTERLSLEPKSHDGVWGLSHYYAESSLSEDAFNILYGFNSLLLFENIVFKSLKTLSTGTTLGPDYCAQHDHWADASEEEEKRWKSRDKSYTVPASDFDGRLLIRTTQEAIRNFISYNPSIEHFCQNSTRGPLSIGPEVYTKSFPTVSIHISQEQSGRYRLHESTHLPIALNTPLRWYMHKNCTRDDRTDMGPARLRELFIRSFKSALSSLDPTTSSPDNNHAQLALDASLYRAPTKAVGSTGGQASCAQVDQAVWKAEMEEMSYALSDEFDEHWIEQPEVDAVDVNVQILPLMDAPQCEACGWKFDPVVQGAMPVIPREERLYSGRGDSDDNSDSDGYYSDGYGGEEEDEEEEPGCQESCCNGDEDEDEEPQEVEDEDYL